MNRYILVLYSKLDQFSPPSPDIDIIHTNIPVYCKNYASALSVEHRFNAILRDRSRGLFYVKLLNSNYDV